jgi:hypothetical protein
MRIKQFIVTVILFLPLLMAASSAQENPKNKPCKDHPSLSGPCFKIRGRMAFYNGAPALRIWPVGTDRILGISEGRFYVEGYDNVPEELVRQLTTFDTVMFADFVVCPFTDDKPGVMRLICVESAENVSIRKRE